jgi:hypothetical protein
LGGIAWWYLLPLMLRCFFPLAVSAMRIPHVPWWFRWIYFFAGFGMCVAVDLAFIG